jgi:hypothetical protein
MVRTFDATFTKRLAIEIERDFCSFAYTTTVIGKGFVIGDYLPGGLQTIQWNTYFQAVKTGSGPRVTRKMILLSCNSTIWHELDATIGQWTESQTDQ